MSIMAIIGFLFPGIGQIVFFGLAMKSVLILITAVILGLASHINSLFILLYLILALYSAYDMNSLFEHKNSL